MKQYNLSKEYKNNFNKIMCTAVSENNVNKG